MCFDFKVLKTASLDTGVRLPDISRLVLTMFKSILPCKKYTGPDFKVRLVTQEGTSYKFKNQ